MKKWFITCTIIALAGCSSSKKGSKERVSEIYHRYGSQQLAEGNYTAALENLLKASESDPDDPNIMNNLALAYYHKKRPTMAKQVLKQLLEAHPDHSDALINMGTIAINEGKLEEAENYFKQVTEHLLFKKQFITYHNLSKVAEKKGQLDVSRNYNRKALEEFDQYCPALFQQGFLLYREKKWNEANNSLKRATKGVCYNYIESHFYRALSLKNLNQLEVAEQILEKLKMDFPSADYMARIDIELEEIRKIKKSESYSRRMQRLSAPQF